MGIFRTVRLHFINNLAKEEKKTKEIKKKENSSCMEISKNCTSSLYEIFSQEGKEKK